MKTIWKFPLAVTDFQKVDMPLGAKVLAVQPQGDQVCLWALVDPAAENDRRGFWIHGTGHPIEHEKHLGAYIGTFQLRGGALVFHVFEHTYG